MNGKDTVDSPQTTSQKPNLTDKENIGQTYSHCYTEAHGDAKKVIDRLSRAIGHLKAVRNMVEDRRACPDILIQLSAVRASINAISKEILKDHINYCFENSGISSDTDAYKELTSAIDTLTKQNL